MVLLVSTVFFLDWRRMYPENYTMQNTLEETLTSQMQHRCEGSNDEMKLLRLEQILRSVKETNRTHSRCAMWRICRHRQSGKDAQDERLNESVIPIVNETQFFYKNELLSQQALHISGEFDPGSGRTLAACLTHASRTG